MTTVVIATRNAHKVQEIKAILGPGYRFFTLDDFSAAPPVREDGATFDENAHKKSVSLARWLLKHAHYRRPLIPEDPAEKGPVFALADDSGLEVDALGGAPGVHSARYAHIGTDFPGNAPDAANNRKLLAALKGIPEEKRSARFRCVVALTPLEVMDDMRRSLDMIGDALDKRVLYSTGACEGRIAFGPTGYRGFGYDPLFLPEGYTDSFANLGEDVKNNLSHRAKALNLMKKWLDQVEKVE